MSQGEKKPTNGIMYNEKLKNLLQIAEIFNLSWRGARGNRILRSHGGGESWGAERRRRLLQINKKPFVLFRKDRKNPTGRGRNIAKRGGGSYKCRGILLPKKKPQR